MRLSRKVFAAAAGASLLLAGCAVGPDYTRPAVDLPAAYPGDAAATARPAGDAAVLRGDWWTLYRDPKLNELVASALERNADVRLAVARIEEADGLLREANATFLPEIDLTTQGTSRSRYSQTQAIPQPAPLLRNDVKLALSTSFELDFWGKLRRGVESVRAQNLSTRYAKDVVTLSLAGLTSQAYFALRLLDAEILVTRETLASRDETLALVRARANAGAASDLDVNQATLARAIAAAQLKDLLRQRALYEHQLGTLTGRLDLKLAEGDLRAMPVPPVPPAGLPSSLLDRRPDVRQAEQDLVANNARIGVAKAAMLPTISLTGTLGGESASLSQVLNNDASRIWSIGFGLVQPIFDAGRLSARTDQAIARQRQALASYQKAVEAAFREVADALSNTQQADAAQADLAVRLEAARNALRLSRLRYEAGYSPFLEVLDAQRTANDAELAALGNQYARLTASVDLMKALGGGWSADSVTAAR